MEGPKNFFTPHVAKYVINNPTFFLALLSAYMYVCAYTYEQAYLKEFGISSIHLNLDVNTIIRDATRIIGIVIILTGTYQLLLRILHPLLIKSKLYNEIIHTIVALLVIVILTWLYLPVNNHLFLYVLLSIGIVYLFILLSPLFKKIKQKVIHKRQNSALSEEKSALSEEKKNYYGFNKYYIYIFLFIINPIFLCQILGQGEAFRQHNFEIVHDSVNYVVIRQYGDKLICKNLTKKNQVENSGDVLNLNNTKPLIISNMELGQISLSNIGEANLVVYLRKHLF